MLRILNAGIREDLQQYLRDKIKISNQVALMTAGIGLIYIVFSIIFYPQLTVYPSFCVFFSIGAIALNFLELYNLSRFLLSTLVLLLAYLYHAFLAQPGEDYITSLIVIEFALSVIPWVLIDYREKTLLIISLSACYTLILSQSWANAFFHIELDSNLFRHGLLNMASFGFGVMILILCLLFMQNKNLVSENQNEKLLRDINAKNTEMEEQRVELQKNLDEIKASRIHEERQNWVAKGLADMTELLRQVDDEKVYIKLLTEIVKYIKANQGGLYLVRQDESGEKYLDLASCYAFDRQKFQTKRIEIGQGLVGQCYLEAEPIIIKEAPEEYINITSGLGDAPPTFIVIVPLMQENTVAGILEIALFKQLESYKIDFLKKLGESIASFVSTNSLNAKTRKLLEQSQAQTERLQAQEEEMRQNMEEMQATQEEMRRKEQGYIERINQLEKLHSENNVQ
ncbi:MAG: GAF domain-containing protein [Cytophagales bacterium]|nr:GAF domain-containing protein [Cytophagales bacterium]